MTPMKIHFQGCTLNSQQYGGDDQHMSSVVQFTIEISGKRFENLSCQVKQTVGSDFENDPLEVLLPEGYDGPINYENYRLAVEHYYRLMIGEAGKAFRFGPNTRASLINCGVTQPVSYELED